MNAALKSTRVKASKASAAPSREYARTKTGRLIPCPGEAHQNFHIDNCGVCSPRWGKVEEYAPVDLDLARREGLDVRACDLSEDQDKVACNLVRSGAASWESAERRNGRSYVSYLVLRWAPVKAPRVEVTVKMIARGLSVRAVVSAKGGDVLFRSVERSGIDAAGAVAEAREEITRQGWTEVSS